MSEGQTSMVGTASGAALAEPQPAPQRGVRLRSLATATPPLRVDQSTAARLAAAVSTPDGARSGALAALYRRTRIASRGSMLLEPGPGCTFYPPARSAEDRGPGTDDRMRRYAEASVDLLAPAAARALDEAETAPTSITHLVLASCTGFVAPGPDVALVKRLGLGADVQRTLVGFMGCHGAFNAMRVAGGLVAADPSAKVLVCAVEICSVHFHYGFDPQQMVSNALFADGAAAAVVEGTGAGTAEPSDLARSGIAPSTGASGVRVVAHGSHIFPDSEQAMTWRITDHGFAMTLSPRVPELIATELTGWLDGWLARHGLDRTDVGSWAVHPGGPRIVSTTAAALGVGDEALAASSAVLRDHGNMSSPTILFILDRLRRAEAPGPWVALGFGPGLTVEAMLLAPGSAEAVQRNNGGGGTGQE